MTEKIEKSVVEEETKNEELKKKAEQTSIKATMEEVKLKKETSKSETITVKDKIEQKESAVTSQAGVWESSVA